jgi:hypothetical protein
MTEKKENIESEKQHKDKSTDVQPEPETLNTTDPQDHMEGPVSSLMHGTGEGFDTDKSPKEAEKEKNEKM